ncbi:hypothetical protein V6N12_036400 [Hibiscus sabdariffa]|uniref:Uncharacterized protein n=1 Tax=Hibiscus sabdariffa TaxID=183260 RepID=A0ABR2ET32_9ROSI
MQTAKRGKATVESSSVNAPEDLKAAATVDALVMSLAPMFYAGVLSGAGKETATEHIPSLDDVIVGADEVIIDHSGPFPSVAFSDSVHDRLSCYDNLKVRSSLYGHAMDGCVTSCDSEKDQGSSTSDKAGGSRFCALLNEDSTELNDSSAGNGTTPIDETHVRPVSLGSHKNSTRANSVFHNGNSTVQDQVEGIAVGSHGPSLQKVIQHPVTNVVGKHDAVAILDATNEKRCQRLVSTNSKLCGSRKRIGDHGFGEHGASPSTALVSSAPQDNAQVTSTVMVNSQTQAAMDNVDKVGRSWRLMLLVCEDICRRNHPHLVALMEPRISRAHADKVVARFGFSHSFHVEFIHGQARLVDDSHWVYFTAVYANTHVSIRRGVWDMLALLRPSDDKSWILGEFVFDNGLLEADFRGDEFTWKRGTVRKRLDRCPFNAKWAMLFPNSVVTHLVRVGSYHCPLFFHVPRQYRASSNQLFRFLAA